MAGASIVGLRSEAGRHGFGSKEGWSTMIRQPRRWPGYVAAAIGLVFVFKYPTTAAELIKGAASFVEWSAARVYDFAHAFH